jgi:hypothetical protein
LFFCCCGSVAALSALANCNKHVAKTHISRPRPPTSSALYTAPTAREAEVVKPLTPPFRIRKRAPPAFSFCLCKTTTRSFLCISGASRPRVRRDRRFARVAARRALSPG